MADRFPSPFEMPTPPGARGVAGAVRVLVGVQRGPPRVRGVGVLVHGRRALARGDPAVGRHHRGVRAHRAVAVQHPALRDPAGPRRRHPHPQRLHVPLPGRRDRPGGDRGADPASSSSAPATTSPTGTGCTTAWLPKVRALIDELETHRASRRCPSARTWRSSPRAAAPAARSTCCPTYHRLVDLTLKLWQHHFEFLNLGYAAYLDFFGFCKQLFPSIPDQAIAKMVAGIEVDLFRPDEELKKLARLAVELGIADRFAGDGPAEQLLAGLRGDPQGDKWLAAWEEAKQPWFNFSAGIGLLPHRQGLDREPGHPARLHPRLHRQGAAGRDLDRPIEAVIAERDRIVDEYTELIDSDEDRATFQGKLGLARTVFPYVENHNFYVEHWAHSVIWRKMRELGAGAGRRGGLLRRRRRRLPAVRGTRCPRRCSTSTTAGRSARRRAGRSTGRGEIAAPQRHHERAAAVVAAAGAGRAARGHHRAVHRHALGHHLGQRRGSGSAAAADGRRADRLRGLARRGRGPGPGHPVRRRDRRPAARARSWSRR